MYEKGFRKNTQKYKRKYTMNAIPKFLGIRWVDMPLKSTNQIKYNSSFLPEI